MIKRTAACFTLLAVFGQSAFAQSEADDERTLGQITVTAEKKPRYAQETPISITALDAEALRSSGANDIQDLQLLTPSLQVSGQASFGELYIRGIGSSALGVGSDPSVTVHRDGIYIGRPSAILHEFLDVERVEVLRGPQGTLYGRNSVGGTVNIVSKLPTTEFEAGGRFIFGNFDQLSQTGFVSGPLNGGSLTGRIAVLKSDRDGFIKNLNQEGPGSLESEDFSAVRGILMYQPTDDIRLLLTADQALTKGTGRIWIPGPGGVVDSYGAVLTDDPFTSNIQTPISLDSKDSGISLETNWRLSDNFSLKTLSAYRENDYENLFDTDGTEVEWLVLDVREYSTQESHELQLTHDNGSALSWIVGAYYFNESSEGIFDIEFRQLGPFYVDIPAKNSTQAVAAFGQASYELTPQVELVFGARYSFEEKSHRADLIQASPSPDSVLSEEASVETLDWDAVTPNFGINVRWTEDLFTYATVRKGFKSGGFNSVGIQPGFDPEFLWAYEGGVKSYWFERKLLANISYYYYDYSDLQVVAFDQGLTVLTNAAEATNQGMEFELQARPADDLTLFASASFMDASYDDFVTIDPSSPQQGPINLAGNELPNAPSVKYNIGAEYQWPVASIGTARIRADYQYQDATFFSQFNEPDVAEDGFSIFNARLEFTSKDERISLAIFGKNLSDTHYWQNKVRLDTTGFNVSGSNGDPRTYGIELSYRIN